MTTHTVLVEVLDHFAGERNIIEALAYDRDFEQAGFSALLR